MATPLKKKSTTDDPITGSITGSRWIADNYPEWFKAWIDRKPVQYRAYWEHEKDDPTATRWLDGSQNIPPSAWKATNADGRSFSLTSLVDEEDGWILEFRLKPDPARRMWTDLEMLDVACAGTVLASRAVTNLSHPQWLGPLMINYGNYTVGGRLVSSAILFKEFNKADGSICGVIEE